jgi:hypothetical protein
LFAISFGGFYVLGGAHHVVYLAAWWAAWAMLAFAWNVGYYRWLRPEQENVHRDPLP